MFEEEERGSDEQQGGQVQNAESIVCWKGEKPESVTLSCPPPPDGPEAWLQTFGAFLTAFIVHGSLYSFSLFIETLENDFGESRSRIALIFNLQLSLVFGLGIVSGPLADIYGVRPVFTIGVVFFVAGNFVAAFSQSFALTVVSQGGLVGVGAGLAYWSSLSIVTQWHEKRKALAASFAALGSGIGNFILPFVIGPFLDEDGDGEGRKKALIIIGSIGGLFLGFSSLFLRRRLAVVGRGSLRSELHEFKHRPLQALFVGVFFFQTTFNSPVGALAAFVSDEGLSEKVSALAVSMLGVGSTFGRIVWPFLSSRLEVIECYKIAAFVIFGTIVFWNFAKTKVAVLAFAFLLGFSSGGLIAITPLMIPRLFGEGKSGIFFGYISVALLIGSFVGPSITGALYDANGNYDKAIIVASVFAACMVSSFCAIRTKDVRTRVK